jgi:hypothetical protein
VKKTGRRFSQINADQKKEGEKGKGEEEKGKGGKRIRTANNIRSPFSRFPFFLFSLFSPF